MKARSGRAHARTRARERFIRRLAESGNVAYSLRKAGIPQRTAYDWRKADKEFAALWDEAERIGGDGIEGEAYRRAVEGWKEPVFQKGRKVGTVTRYSDRMLEILLKGHRPKYRENPTTAVQVNVGDQRTPVELEDRTLEAARALGFVLASAKHIQDERAGSQALLPAPRPSLSGNGEMASPRYEEAAPLGAGTKQSTKQRPDPEPEQAIHEPAEDASGALSRAAEMQAIEGGGSRRLPSEGVRHRPTFTAPRRPWRR